VLKFIKNFAEKKMFLFARYISFRERLELKSIFLIFLSINNEYKNNAAHIKLMLNDMMK